MLRLTVLSHRRRHWLRWKSVTMYGSMSFGRSVAFRAYLYPYDQRFRRRCCQLLFMVAIGGSSVPRTRVEAEYYRPARLGSRHKT
ncbi:hypothetical protein BDZ89DRAFT_785052 [Hymenopellis radicata]|nr:hypothetical protein BDZ89DRAFT_785052 [Hymenopellis radicata]